MKIGKGITAKSLIILWLILFCLLVVKITYPASSTEDITKFPKSVGLSFGSRGIEPSRVHLPDYHSQPKYQTKYVNYEYNQNISSEKIRLQSLKGHQFLRSTDRVNLLEYMLLISKQPQCSLKPVFVSMARVQSDLYWQLIKNFFSTMIVFDHIDCVVMVCISDNECQRRCQDSYYPCFNYIHPNASMAHVMEQVATVKLYHMSVALEAGIHILLLDLDVGFLRDPMLLFDKFLDSPYEQVRQEQVVIIINSLFVIN